MFIRILDEGYENISVIQLVKFLNSQNDDNEIYTTKTNPHKSIDI